MKKLLIILTFCLMGCGSDSEQNIVHKYTLEKEITTLDQEIKNIIDQENQYRLLIGQLPYTNGLTCTLHNLQNSQPSSIPSSSPTILTYTYIGEFNHHRSNNDQGINILPEGVRDLYKEWYLIRCQGYIVIINDSKYTTFYLTSDDGSNLYIDGTILINNDGNHVTQTKFSSKALKRGVHSFKLDYMQGPGDQSLILEDINGVITSNRFYR